MQRFCIILLLAAVFAVACSKKDTVAPVEVEQFEGFKQPSNFPAPAYNMAGNPITKAGFELGRSLFFEPRLSRNNTISCGSCHIPSSAFTQHGHEVSHGIDDLLGTRNSSPIMNMAWRKTFFWDGGVFDLDLQPIVPITNHVEMDESVENVMKKLRQMPKYTGMFKAAFGSEEITTARMMKALSQFMLMCVSANSKYDSVMRKLPGANFTATEQTGYALFKEHCADCHKEPLFTDESFRDNGIGVGLNNDEGRYLVTLNPADKYKFKVPSLRNLTYTGPYMHDGRFLNLNGVLEHYINEVQNTANLDPLLKQGAKPGIPLSAQEKTDILSFLQTLNDRSFVNNKLIAEQ